ncbi:flagellar protein FlaG [Litorivicinus sp.]|nr:flagellar protein FlaG [Litorivicinus sp.]
MSEIPPITVDGGVQEAVKKSEIFSRSRDSVEIAGPQAPKPIEQNQELKDKASSAMQLANESMSPDKLAELVKGLQQAMPASANSLRFRIDEVLDRAVVSVIDDKSGELIRQLPTDEVIRAAHNIDKMRGIIFDGFDNQG